MAFKLCLIFTVLLAGLVYSMTVEEIQRLKKELDGELLKLELENSAKKSLDNDQIAVTSNDDSAALEHLLSHFYKPHKPKTDEKRSEVLEDEALLRLLSKKDNAQPKSSSTKESDAALLDLLIKEDAKKSDTPSKTPSKEESDAALLDLLIKEDAKKSDTPSKTASKKESDAALLELLMKEDAKKSDAALLDLLIKEDAKESVEQRSDASTIDEAAFIEMLQADERATEAKKEGDVKSKLLQEFLAEHHDDNKRTVSVKKSGCFDELHYCKQLTHLCKSHSVVTEKCKETCDACTPCEKGDKWPIKICGKAKNVGYCEEGPYVKRLKANCYKTCGYCRAPSPPACQLDPEGCCWDGVTPRKFGCYPCEDQRPRFCKRFKVDCENRGLPGQFMKSNCVKTCKRCDPFEVKMDCFDDIRYLTACKKFKEGEEKCEGHVFAPYCKKTCKLCVATISNAVKVPP